MPQRTYAIVDGIEVPPSLERTIAAFSAPYFAQTNKVLVVTSGFRGANRQADSMYTNFANWYNHPDQYQEVQYQRQDLYLPIKKCFFDLYPRPNTPKTFIVDEMRKLIQGQMDNGQFLSQHMNGRAADFDKNSDVNAMTSICKEEGHFIMVESACIHITFSRLV